MDLADREAERIVLGAMLLDSRAVEPVTEMVAGRDFHDPKHAAIFAAIVSAWSVESPTDPTAIAAAMAASGELGRAGGTPYLHELIAAVPTVANGPWYARRVAEFAHRRRILTMGIRVQQAASDPAMDVDQVEALAERELREATGSRSASMQGLDDLLDSALPGFLAEYGPDRGLSTGVGILDDQIGGLKPGQLTIVAGRPGSGKSVMCVDVARANIRRGVPVGFYSLEMYRDELVGRILAATAEVNLFRVLNGGMRHDERARLSAASERLRGTPLWIRTGDVDLPGIRSTARQLRSRGKLELLIVDYLQLMTAPRRESRVLEVGDISRGLKRLATELEIPVLAAAQLNRAAESRIDRRPQLSDLRESGSLEQDCDIAILVHRPDQYDRNTPRVGEVDLIVAKNRNGPIDTVTAIAQLEYSRFVDGDIR